MISSHSIVATPSPAFAKGPVLRSEPDARRPWLASVAILLFCCGLTGCGKSAAPVAAAPPAKVGTIAHEETLNTVELTPEAEKRLGVETAPTEMRSLPRLRKYGAEITVPQGASVIVSAPVGGTLKAPSASGVPRAGMAVTRGQKVFELLPLLSPERAVLTPAERVRFAEAKNAVATSRIDAAGLVQQGEVQVESAKIALDRAERLLREQAGTVRAVDDAKAMLNLAQKTLEAAQARQRLLDKLRLDEEAGVQQALDIESPQEGIIRSISAADGEVVAVGAPLFEVLDVDPVWVRVPVYVGEAPQIAADQSAKIGRLGEASNTGERVALPVSAPPTAMPLASAVDLYYELANPGGELRPGERVIATLGLSADQETLAVPWSSVVHDINGGTWVYEQVAPHKFARRRVQIRYVVDGFAALAQGPAEKALVVTAGAVELFGTEFGFAK
jgi:membrane fusion protein, heavy metal efflux system